MKTFAITVLFAGVATLANAQQARWSASAVTAAPDSGFEHTLRQALRALAR